MLSTRVMFFVNFFFASVLLLQNPFSQGTVLDNDQRFRFFKGAQINVKEKNITFTTCNCKHLDFEFLQRDGDPKHYHVKNRKAECQEYQIVSIYGKVQVHTENEKTETVNIDSFLEEIVLKCYSNETRWRISEDCSSSSPGRSCQINCLTRNCQETAEDITFKNSDKLYKTIIPQVKYVKKLEQPPSVPLVTISFELLLVIVAVVILTGFVIMMYHFRRVDRELQEATNSRQRLV